MNPIFVVILTLGDIKLSSSFEFFPLQGFSELIANFVHRFPSPCLRSIFGAAWLREFPAPLLPPPIACSSTLQSAVTNSAYRKKSHSHPAIRPAPRFSQYETSIWCRFLWSQKRAFFWNNLALKCSNFCHCFDIP